MGAALGKWSDLVNYVSGSLLGGPRPFTQATVINVQKAGTLLWCLYWMNATGNYSGTACLYTALHGSYGLCWLLKEMVFPDPGWQRPVTIPSALIMSLTVLGPYWIAPYLCITNRFEASPALMGLSTGVYALGLALMIGADAQKYFTLKHKRGLITSGFFAATRNPNYLGEMMIYGSFAALSGHREPWFVLAAVWGFLFVPNMVRKDRSMSRYGAAWVHYQAHSGLLLPWLPTLARGGAPPARP